MQFDKRFWGTLFALVLCAVLASSLAPAQTIHGTLTGTVFDATGAVVPGVKIIVRSLDTGIAREVQTNDIGVWIARALPVGRYSLEFDRPGFERMIRQPIQVDAAVERAVDVTLQTGSTTELVSVVAEAVLIQTTQAQLSRGVDARRILELPGQNTLNALALLSPGASPNNNSRPGSGFSINGGRTRSNNFTIDGANNNDQSLAIPRQNVPPEVLGEFRIITNNFSAEFGRNSGTVVQQITRSGTNEFHGIARWTWYGNGYDALTTNEERTFKAQKAAGRSDQDALRAARGVRVNNQGLVSVGGPIKKDSVFFFTSHDRDWNRRSVVSLGNALSPAAIQRLDANASRFAPGVLDFLKSTWPTANDPTVRGTVNVAAPAGVTFADGSTTLALPLQQYNRGAGAALSAPRDIWRWLQKVDMKLSSRDTLSARFLIDDDLNQAYSIHPVPGNDINTAIRNISQTVNYTRIFSPTTLNEARATYARRSADFVEQFGPQITITGSGLPTVGNQNFPQNRTDNVYELTDNLSIMQGRHNLRIGANLMRYDLNSFFAPATLGVLRYPSMADLLFDRNAEWTQYAGNANTMSRTYELGAFFQDDFRVNPSLTLNLGVRYERTGAPLGYFSNAKADINNWAPRLGFAYAPRHTDGLLGWLSGNGRMSIRGGYAIAYDQVFQNILLNNSRNYPRGVTVATSPTSGARWYNAASRPPAPTPDDYVKAGNNPKLLPIRLYSPNKRIKQPMGQQYSLGIERQLFSNYAFRIFYVGSRGSGMVREIESNLGFTAAAVQANPGLLQPVITSYGMQPVRNAAGTITGYRVDPTSGSILIGDALAMSTYHSLQTTIEKRYANGFMFELNYTYSSFINDSDDILGGYVNSTLPAVPFNFKLDRGRSGLDVPHRMVGNFIYEFPKPFVNQAVLGRVLGGWQLNGIVTLQSGTPYTIFNANNALGILPAQIATVTNSQRATFNPAGAAGTAGGLGATLPRYIALPTNSGLIGTMGRNTERTGGHNMTDFALVKNTRLWSESTSVQFRWEVSNAFNRRCFTVIPPNTVANSTNLAEFMNLGMTNVTGRSMTFVTRILF